MSKSRSNRHSISPVGLRLAVLILVGAVVVAGIGLATREPGSAEAASSVAVTTCANDGSANAPPGVAPSIPNLTAGDAFPPPCRYPGQYGVGANPATAVGSPAKATLGAAAQIDAAHHFIRVMGGPLTLSHLNMSPANGVDWQIVGFPGCHDLTIRDVRWKLTTDAAMINTGPCINVTISGVTGDSNQVGNALGAAVNIGATGHVLVAYSDFRNSPSHEIDVSSAGALDLEITDSLIGDNGSGISKGDHPDWVQVFGNGVFTIYRHHNTLVMDRNGIDGTQGFNCGDNYFKPSCPSVVDDDNFFYLPAKHATGGVSYVESIDWTETGHAEIKNNWVDGADIAFGFCRGGYASGQADIANNIDVHTGKAWRC